MGFYGIRKPLLDESDTSTADDTDEPAGYATLIIVIPLVLCIVIGIVVLYFQNRKTDTNDVNALAETVESGNEVHVAPSGSLQIAEAGNTEMTSTA